MQTALIGVDWGTSRLRCLRIGPSGELLEHREGSQGIASIQDRAFDPALHDLIGDWQDTPGRAPILMCGMVGSRQGWHEVPYVPCPAGLADFLPTLQPVQTTCGLAHIVAGAVTLDASGLRDIMRGEEIQILGVTGGAGPQLAIAPGTHSKWATVEEARILSFKTYMTGEIYSLLRERSTLAWVMPVCTDASVAEDAFLDGVRRTRDDPDLLHLLFSVRTRGLLQDLPAAALAAYLSGLLIGAEVAGGLRHHRACTQITVIGSPALTHLYRLALSESGYPDVTCRDAAAAVAQGLSRLWRLRQEASRA